MTTLKRWYASAPVDDYEILTVEILIPNYGTLRYCNGYEDRWLGVNGTPQLFTASPLSVALPDKDTSGQQTLRFGFAGVSGQAQKAVDAALETGLEIKMVYRMYLNSNTTAPAARPLELTVVGGTFEKPNVTFEGAYFDLLNSRWPRDSYTSASAPGIQWM